MAKRLGVNPSSNFVSKSVEETLRIGTVLGVELQEGDFVALQGELGSGKTTLAGGIGMGLGVEMKLASPTYLLCREYEGRHLLFHLDAYFEGRMEAVLAEGLAERLAGPGVVIVEWPEKMEPWLPSDRLAVELEGVGMERQISFKALGPHSEALLARFRAAAEKLDKNT